MTSSRGGPPEDLGTIEEGPLSAALAALARDDPNGVVAALDGQLHHGRPGSPASLRQQVGEQLAVALASQTGRINRWIDSLATSASPTGRQVACLLLASRYEQDRAGVLRAAEALADDAHCEVLRSSRSENVRRAVVLAAKYAARRDRPERVAALLDLLEPLLRDETPYVRRNLGPFALGDALLRVDPRTTLQRLRQWSRDRDPMVRWNVAMAFSTAIGSFHWPAAKAVLDRLARGPEPVVRMAVAKAVRRCRQRFTEDVEDTIRAWQRDRERQATAQLVGPARRR